MVMAAEEENAGWERAVAANTPDAYQTYLQGFPTGAHADEARLAIATLNAPEIFDGGAAQAAEAALGLTEITQRMVEARLLQSGLRPGRIDGVFDAQTREALRAFQLERALPGTGFLDEVTVAKLLEDGLEQLGD